MSSKRYELMLNSDNSLQLDLFPFFLSTKYGIPLAREGDGPLRSNKLVILGTRSPSFSDHTRCFRRESVDTEACLCCPLCG